VRFIRFRLVEDPACLSGHMIVDCRTGLRKVPGTNCSQNRPGDVRSIGALVDLVQIEVLYFEVLVKGQKQIWWRHGVEPGGVRGYLRCFSRKIVAIQVIAAMAVSRAQR
jgi:hypothetical protein